MLLRNQFTPDINCVATFRFPIELCHQFHGPHIWGRISVTFQTPAHGKVGNLLDLNHLVDTAMATYTANAHGNVSLVVEINVIRKFVNFDPFNWVAALETFTNGP